MPGVGSAAAVMPISPRPHSDHPRSVRSYPRARHSHLVPVRDAAITSRPIDPPDGTPLRSQPSCPAIPSRPHQHLHWCIRFFKAQEGIVSDLMLHAGGRLVTLDELTACKTPPAEGRWHPVSHV